MRPVILGLLGAVLIVVVAQTQTKLGTAADEAAIRKVQETFEVAWNKHDAKGETYAPDADRITAAGYSSGRAEIEKSYAGGLIGVYKNATIKFDPGRIRFLTADVALHDSELVITGGANGVVKGLAATTYLKRNGEWMVVAARFIQYPAPAAGR
jgi:uncharacterized protein (TIGR02246 family)